MILAAGRGLRMGALTEHTPKPLLKVAGRFLVEYAICALVEAGVRDIVINVSWQARQVIDALSDGSRYGARFQYSFEPEALETGGGIVQALPLLGPEPFIVMSSDIIVEHPLTAMLARTSGLAHLLLVDNPVFRAEGDFSLVGAQVTGRGADSLTYANVGVFSPALFAGCAPIRFPLGPLLQAAVSKGQVTGEKCAGPWWNVGTPELLSEVNALKSGT